MGAEVLANAKSKYLECSQVPSANSLFLYLFSYPNAQQWTATFGISTTSPTLRVRVRTISIHNNYNPVTHENDIAAVQLERAVTFTRDVHRVCLPAATQTVTPGSTAYVTGWGSIIYGGKYLQKDKTAKTEQ